MKGGCAVGKKSGAGGCKVGKKKKVKAPPKIAAAIKARKLKAAEPKKAEKKPTMVKKTKPKFKVVNTLKKPVGTLKPLPAVEKTKRKIKFKIKPAALPELKAITGLTKEQANAMSPEQLFGMLPKELATNIVLNPKRTGVKVAMNRKPALIKARDASKILSSPNGTYFENELKKLPTGEGYSGGKEYFVSEIRKWEKKTEIKYGMKYRYKVPRGASIIGPRKKLARYNALESSGYLRYEAELRKLDKKDDETKFGGSAKLTDENIVDRINKIIRFGTPKAKLGSKNMIKLGNEFAKALFRINRWTHTNYDDFDFVRSFKEDQILLKKRLDLLEKTMKDAGVKNASGTYGGSGQRLPEILQSVGLRK